MRVVQHSGYVRSDECPTIGCPKAREVVCKMTLPDGSQTTVSACTKHVEWYVARAITRWIQLTEGQEGVVRHVDAGERRCCK